MNGLLEKTVVRELTCDEKKAAEAAFQGLRPDPNWTFSARHIYDELRNVMLRRGKIHI